jgi:hypothetical protein
VFWLLDLGSDLSTGNAAATWRPDGQLADFLGKPICIPYLRIKGATLQDIQVVYWVIPLASEGGGGRILETHAAPTAKEVQ